MSNKLAALDKKVEKILQYRANLATKIAHANAVGYTAEITAEIDAYVVNKGRDDRVIARYKRLLETYANEVL